MSRTYQFMKMCRAAIKHLGTGLRAIYFALATLLLLHLTFSASAQSEAKIPTAREKSVMQLPVDGYALSLAWSHDGRLLAASSANFTHVTIWDTTTGNIVQKLERGVAFGQSLAFMPGDKFLLTSAAYKNTPDDQRAAVSLWEVATGKMVRNVAGPYPAGGVNESMADSFSLGADGRVLAVVFHGGIPVSAGLYDTRNWSLTETLKSFPKLRGQSGVAIASAVAVSPNGLYVGVGRTDGGIDIYSSDGRTLLTRIDAYPEAASAVTGLIFSPDSQDLLSISSGNGEPQPNGSAGAIPDALRVWNVSNGSSVLSLRLKAGAGVGKTRGIAWSNDGQHLATASDDHLVRLWEKANPQSPAVVARFPREAWDVSFSPDGKRLAASGWNSVLITEIAN